MSDSGAKDGVSDEEDYGLARSEHAVLDRLEDVTWRII